MEHELDGIGADVGLKEGGRVGDDGDGTVIVGGEPRAMVGRREQVGGGHALRGEDAVDCVEGELSPAMEKIGQMRLAETGLARQQGDTEAPPLNSAEQFQPETLVHLGKIHLWIIRHQQRQRIDTAFFQKS